MEHEDYGDYPLSALWWESYEEDIPEDDVDWDFLFGLANDEDYGADSEEDLSRV